MAIRAKDLPPEVLKALGIEIPKAGPKAGPPKKAPPGTLKYALRGFVQTLLQSYIIKPLITVVSITSMWVFHAIMKVLGPEAWKAIQFIGKTYYTDPSKWGAWVATYIENMTGKKLDVEELAKGGARVLSDGVVKDFSKEIMDKLLGLIVPSGEITEEKATDAAANYLSVNMQFQMSAWLLHMIGDVQSFGMFKSLKDLPNAISWSFGLGWLSWLVMGTPFQKSIVTGLGWKYNAYLRPSRMSEKQLHEAVRRGLISVDDWNYAMEQEGWRDIDKAILYKIDEKDYPDSVVRDSYLHGLMDRENAEREMKRKGYSAERAKSLVSFWELEKAYDVMQKIYNEYEDLYVDDKVTREDLKVIAKQLVRNDLQVELRLDLADLKKVKSKRITRGDIKSALAKDVIGVVQARQKLLNSGYSEEDADFMLRTWQK